MNSNKVLEYIKKTLARRMPAGGQAYLYGSRARGDNRPNSDWDILLLLNKKEDDPLDGVSYSLHTLGWDLNEEISPVTYTKDEWKKYSFTPFYHNVKKDGIQIYGANLELSKEDAEQFATAATAFVETVEDLVKQGKTLE